MNKKNQLKLNKWETKLISGVCFTNKEYYGTFMHKHHNRFIFDFALMRSYFIYGCGVLRSVVNFYGKLMILSDRANVAKGIQITAMKAGLFYGCGNWRGGVLTKIKVFVFVPSFLVSLGFDYPCNFLNEANLLQIPTINFIFDVCNKHFFINNYSLPAVNREPNVILQLSNLFTFFAQKYNHVKLFTKFVNNKVIHLQLKNILLTLNKNKRIYTNYTTGIVCEINSRAKILINRNKIDILIIALAQRKLLLYYYKDLHAKEKQLLIISHKKYFAQKELHIKTTYIKKQFLNITQFSALLLKKHSKEWIQLH